MDNLFSIEDLEDVLSEFNSSNESQTEAFLEASMTDEMKASQKRYEDYIKKHENDN